jgi:multicomponent K+:H+ antiporter subunit D
LATGSNRLASYSIVVSAGTLRAAIGFDREALSAGALFYLASSTLAGYTLFLLVELLERRREVELAPPQAEPHGDALPDFAEVAPPQPANLDDGEAALIGRALPAAVACLGVGFTLCALVVAGLPPLPGFIGKVAMLGALLDAGRPAAWAFFALLLSSGLLAATSLLRVGARHFWVPQEWPSPRLRVVEGAPIALLLAALAALAIHGEPVLRYMRLATQGLHAPDPYIAAVMSAQPVGRRAQESLMRPGLWTASRPATSGR